VYTWNIFNQFQDELLERFKFKKEKLGKEGSSNSNKYMVSKFQNSHEILLVTLDTTSFDVSCHCHLFEFKDILYRHVLAIFNKKNVDKIPHKYILLRWKKMVAEGIFIPLFKNDGDKLARDLQFNNIINQLRPYLHISREAFDTIMEALDIIFKSLQYIKDSKGSY
jgi:hypothetical protein